MRGVGSRASAWLLAAAFSGWMVACGASTELTMPRGGAGAGGAGASKGGAAGTYAGGIPLPSTECVVAVHADQCCGQPVAVKTASLASDPCLIPYGLQYLPAVIAVCPAAQGCAQLRCAQPAPLSRIAAADPAGNCRFANECANDADCTVASDLTGCCGCPEAVPKKLALVNPCISPPGAPAGVVCNQCGPVACSPCPSMPAAYCADANGSGTVVCVEAWPQY
jgi:hypothetical protein